MKRFFHSIFPAALLSLSVGQIYAFTNFADEIARGMGCSQKDVQFAFSLGIFFLGMGAAFFGRIVERNIKFSTILGTLLFLSGLCVTGLGITSKSLPLLYLGYGVMVGTGTGIIYISPVKTMMLWFPASKALASSLPIIAFGIGSTISTILYSGFSFGDVESLFSLRYMGLANYFNVSNHIDGMPKVFYSLAFLYLFPMTLATLLLKKPKNAQIAQNNSGAVSQFRYRELLCDGFFLRTWLFMFLNISAGLCLIPLAKQMMHSPAVGYSESVITAIVAISGIFNGGGRFAFAYWSDRFKQRIDIMLVILGLSAGIMTCSFWPPLIGVSLLVINACYGAGFSVIPAVLADHYGLNDISKIHGAVLSAWGVAGIAGNQAAITVAKTFGGYGSNGRGYFAVIVMLVLAYTINFINVYLLRRKAK